LSDGSPSDDHIFSASCIVIWFEAGVSERITVLIKYYSLHNVVVRIFKISDTGFTTQANVFCKVQIFNEHA
jgi:hypothetical protein